MGRGPTILRMGNPNCIHDSYIDSDLIAHCRKPGCGQVAAYGGTSAVPEYMEAKRAKGGEANRKRAGSANVESKAWNGMHGQKSQRALVKGVDF